VLWRAVCKAQWSWAVEWREAFLVFARRCEGEPSRRMVAYFFTQHCAPADLVTLLEHLAKERVLVPRDARRIEELLLTQVHKDGLWKHQQGRRQPA
jgi:hypothetical protein